MDYVERGKVREQEPDPSMAESLFERAESKYENMESLGITEGTATDYLENVYEAVKMMIQAFMSADGYHPYSHEAIIAYAIDQLDLSLEQANKFNKYRKLRNDIAYRGEIVTEHEAEDIKQLFIEVHDNLSSRTDEITD